jgi:hypothetical protein
MKKTIALVVLIASFTYPLIAQKTGEKVKTTTQKMSDKSAKAAADVQETANNVNATVNNARTILRVFDPFLAQLKRKGRASVSETGNGDAQNNGQTPQNTEGANPSPSSDNSSQTTGNQGNTTDSQGSTSSSQGNTADGQGSTSSDNSNTSTTYNSDGTAFWGCQDHQQYGCYLDAQKGIIADDVDVATQTGAIDVIFATAKSQIGAIYHLVSPSYAKNNPKAGLFFSGEKYKVGKQPVKQWPTANGSEIAATTLTGAQFEKVKSNDQLMAVVNQTGGFQEFFSSRTKLDGKVFAVRTQIENRTSYALIYVVEHVGVSGSSCFLKVKLKVNGMDANGDGLPD